MKKTIFFNILIGITLVVCLVFLFNIASSLFQNRVLDNIISSELSKSRISNRDMVGKVRHVYVEKRYWVPDSFSFDEFEKRFKRSLERSGFQLLSGLMSSRETVINGKKEMKEEVSYLIAERSSNVPIMRLTLIRKVPYRPAAKKAKPSVSPKIAIVLDDWGYNTKNLNAILQVNSPVTLSILPGLPHSAVIAQKAKEHNFEVILHMPMEPKSRIRLELNTLSTNMADDEIGSALARALETVPHADGISNHEGSKATEDARLMRIVFGELKKKNLFFLDSLVTNESVCEPLAKEMKVRFAKRSVFLDNENNPAYIRRQFEKAVNLAVKTGEVIAIGHDRPNTIAVLKEMIPKFEENGIEMTYVSELAK